MDRESHYSWKILVKMASQWIFSQDRALHFRHWLNLSMSDLIWTDEHMKSFDEFWILFFEREMSFKEIHNKFYMIEKSMKTGTLRRWIRWLRDRFNCYLFVFEKINLRDLALDTYYRINDLAYTLREFLIEEYPDKKKDIDKYLSVGNYLSPNLYISFDSLQKNLKIRNHIQCRNEQGFMSSLEVPFFEEFPHLVELLKSGGRSRFGKNFSPKGFGFFLGKVLVYTLSFLLASVLLVWGIKGLRDWNSNYLKEKIKISIPSFYDEKILERGIVSPRIFIDEKIEKKLPQNYFDFDEESIHREETETDFVIASIQDSSLSIKSAKFEDSTYEEKKKGGFRDYRYGRSRAYRLFINSMYLDQMKKKIDEKLKSISYRKADNVEPGKLIPGGRYYNLYIKDGDVKSFLESFQDTDSKVYVSKTPVKSPRGMSHIFIWIKEI